MSRDSKINQFIPLHFYEPSEKLPDKDDWTYKIVVRKSSLTDSGYDFSIAQYYRNDDTWVDDHLYEIDNVNVIAWASFSAGWVTGSESFPEKWGCQ